MNKRQRAVVYAVTLQEDPDLLNGSHDDHLHFRLAQWSAFDDLALNDHIGSWWYRRNLEDIGWMPDEGPDRGI